MCERRKSCAGFWRSDSGAGVQRDGADAEGVTAIAPILVRDFGGAHLLQDFGRLQTVRAFGEVKFAWSHDDDPTIAVEGDREKLANGARRRDPGVAPA